MPQLIRALSAEGAGEVLVVCGGVVPRKDYEFLKREGVAAVFGPGTPITTAAGDVLGLLRRQRKAA